jgi:hypothetical protein
LTLGRYLSRTIVLATLMAVIVAMIAAPALALPSISSDAFLAVEGCGCHSGFIETWRDSMHAKALTDPLYQYKLDEAKAATDGALGPYCEACHAPVAVMAGEMMEGATLSPQGGEGVACDFCHQVTGRTDPIGNTSVVITPDGVKRAQWDNARSPVHETEYSPFHETAEFCGSCHNVNHPVNGLALESTYTEWKNGPYAADGIVCQDCHMTPGPGVTKPNPGVAAGGGPQRDHVYTMTFAGGNVALGDSALAEERLQAAAELELNAPTIVEKGQSAEVTVKITNVGAGHYLPTGLTEVRQMWLEVVATTTDGEQAIVGRHDFGSILQDSEGRSPVEPWEAVSFAVDDRIPPKESVEDAFELTMPESGEVELSAVLYYRSASEEMADAAGVEVPTTTMASVSQAIYGSQDIADEANTDSNGGSGSSTMLLVFAVGGLVLAGLLLVLIVSRRRSRAS